MVGDYEVCFGKKPCGKVQVERQGLYYRFFCRCQLGTEVMCRLTVSCGGKQEDLGILVPVGDGFGLDTRIPAKRLGKGTPEFSLRAKQGSAEGTFVPIYPEEPFSYLSRLKESYLVYKNGQAGILV